ncbi:MAG TPA: aminotransferase class V-fold PLP-dependent enzyme [Pseudacidobacterium sp.]|jgi:glutamate/tyrosine decarboxylase-like PLP-dependent enzyme|nr:aminotransferase class V-fold PLP-dependent enzyme [Pseudacidobacterium sp.]
MKQDQALELLNEALPKLQEAFSHLPASKPEQSIDGMRAVLAQLTERLADEYPLFHPLYAGQMLKPPHPIARAAYAMAMWINPNNHALDGGLASSRLEVEAVREIAAMFGWTEYLGHLTSGGTVANLEGLWVAGQLAHGKKVVASENAHYTHSRISAVLGLPFSSIAADKRGRMDLAALEVSLQTGEIGTVVVTLGTTLMGAIDPLDEILNLRKKYSFRIHVDAAYGGYYKLVSNLGPDATRAFAKIHEADSIVVDPHKHGLQPYGCGCILFRDPTVGRFYKHDSPYTYFTSNELHLGEISLECSRAGAAATALWATQQLLPLVPEGEFSHRLSCSRKAALYVYEKLTQDARFLPGPEPELDILVWAMKADTLEGSSRLAKRVFDLAANQNLHLALAQIPVAYFESDAWQNAQRDSTVTCLRSVLMKPEHLEWVDAIWERLSEAAAQAC